MTQRSMTRTKYFPCFTLQAKPPSLAVKSQCIRDNRRGHFTVVAMCSLVDLGDHHEDYCTPPLIALNQPELA